jgi:hypothetical protein
MSIYIVNPSPFKALQKKVFSGRNQALMFDGDQSSGTLKMPMKNECVEIIRTWCITGVSTLLPVATAWICV